MSKSPLITSPRDVVVAFNKAWDAHDLEAVLALVSEGCVFESARAGDNGPQIVGRTALRAAWAPGFAKPIAAGGFSYDEIIVAGDRVVQLWTYHMGDKSVRGVDVMRVECGEITEKFGYVKVTA
ncbi:MAG TPA: nuclear transport factor 2 family protein [Spongiibacteraceae bacterium]|nr:nuclear transport factor 2 family protein [Spongiibacteraceae bacterium]